MDCPPPHSVVAPSRRATLPCHHAPPSPAARPARAPRPARRGRRRLLRPQLRISLPDRPLARTHPRKQTLDPLVVAGQRRRSRQPHRQLEQLAPPASAASKSRRSTARKATSRATSISFRRKWMEHARTHRPRGAPPGLGVDMATGTGWPFGGPWVTEEQAMQRLALKDGRLTGELTKMMVKRAAPGGEGLVDRSLLDPDRPARATSRPSTRLRQTFPAI
jgi:hypothetical protein